MNKAVREINPEALFQLVMRRWDLVLLLPLLTVLAAGLAWQIMPARYESTARLLIQDQQTVNPFMEDMVEEWSAQKRMPLVDSIFRSHSTSEQVLRKLGRLDVAATPEEVNIAVDEFQHSFEVIGLGGEIVLLKVRGPTPEEAYDATRALVDTFTERILHPQKETVRASAVFFQEQLDQLRGENPEVEPQVAQLPEAEKPNLAGEINIRLALAEAEARLAAVEQEVELSEENLRERSPGELELRKQLASARRRLYVLSQRYGRSHPELAAAKRRVRWLEKAIEQEREGVEHIMAAPDSDGTPSQRKPKTSDSAKHQALLLKLKHSSAEVELLRNRLLTEKLSIFGDGNQIWPVEAPVMPTRPIGPSLLTILPAALLGGLLLALIAVAFFAAFDDSLRGEKELAEAIGAPSLGRMPRGEV